MTTNKRVPIPVAAAAVLLCLTLFSFRMMTGMVARYIVRGTDGSETVVAAFGVESSADEVNPVTITADGTDDNGKTTYTVTIKNTGEVAVSYSAIVEFTGDDAQENAEKFDTADENLTFTGELEPGGEAQETVTLDMSEYFDDNNKYSTFSNDDISGGSGTAPFTVTVTFTQLD